MASAAAAIDSTLDIVTPENIEFEYQVAGPLRRMPAFLIDAAIRILVVIILGILIILVAGTTRSADLAALGTTFLLILWFFLEWLYGGVFETFWNGQTPGKRMLGLRVLTTHGEPINGLQAVLRNILRFVDMMPTVPPIAFATVFGVDLMDPQESSDVGMFLLFILCVIFLQFTFLVGLVVPAFNRRRQRLGDLVCQTMVIVEERNWLYGMERMDDPRVRELAAQLPPHVDVGRSTAKALAMYVERRRFFSSPRRQEIAMHLGHPLIERCHLPPVSDHDLLLCAIYYKVFFTENLDEPPRDNPYGVTAQSPMTSGPVIRR